MADTRKRLNRPHETATHGSMVESLLCELSGTMTSDAASGRTNLLKIKARLDAIRANRTNVNPGRSAVDARFAMGYTDDAYLNQACIPVWAGVGASARRACAMARRATRARGNACAMLSAAWCRRLPAALRAAPMSRRAVV